MNSVVIEFLGVKGLISPGEVSFLMNEVAGLFQSMRLNLVIKEELEYIRSVFSKGDTDKIGVEELKKLRRLLSIGGGRTARR